MDVNQTSTVSFLEFNKFVFDGHISVNLLADLQGDDPKKALAALFQAVDSDGSGTCSNLELHRALQELTAGPSNVLRTLQNIESAACHSSGMGYLTVA